MELLASGERLVVDMEEWITKSSGRGSITLGVDSEEWVTDPSPIASWSVFLGLTSYAEVVPRLFAWADVGIHPETYDEADYEQYEAECVFYDNEGDRIVRELFDEWRSSRPVKGLRPYANAMDEVDFWRLELTLNDLGKAFLTIDGFATRGNRQLTL